MNSSNSPVVLCKWQKCLPQNPLNCKLQDFTKPHKGSHDPKGFDWNPLDVLVYSDVVATRILFCKISTRNQGLPQSTVFSTKSQVKDLLHELVRTLGKPGNEIMSVHTYTIETRAGHSPYRLRIFTDRKSLSKRSVLALCAPPCQKKRLFFCIHINKVGQGPLSYVTGENVLADVSYKVNSDRVRVAGRKS